MRKTAIGITVAFGLLLAGVLAWSAAAAPLTGTTSVRPVMSHVLPAKANCPSGDKGCPAGWFKWGRWCCPCAKGICRPKT